MAERDERARSPFPDHTGQATWGERRVPLERFRRAAAENGRALDEQGREQARRRFLDREVDRTPVEGPYERIAVLGGVYSNTPALEAALEQAQRRGAQAIYCLGDLGGFGPVPESVWPLLQQADVRCIQGNYEESLSSGATDCNCGYTDPRDNHFAALSYGYTERNCSAAFKGWMGRLPRRRRLQLGSRELLLVHGSPERINEFLFQSTTSLGFAEKLLDRERADAILCTHTGLHWWRRLPSGRDMVNVGVIGRPANDGDTRVHYGWIEAGERGLEVELVPLAYDFRRLARLMRRERLPEPFVETILSGWWTTCLEILPAAERGRSRY